MNIPPAWKIPQMCRQILRFPSNAKRESHDMSFSWPHIVLCNITYPAYFEWKEWRHQNYCQRQWVESRKRRSRGGRSGRFFVITIRRENVGSQFKYRKMQPYVAYQSALRKTFIMRTSASCWLFTFVHKENY